MGVLELTDRSEHCTCKKWTLIRSWTKVVFYKLWLLQGSSTVHVCPLQNPVSSVLTYM